MDLFRNENVLAVTSCGNDVHLESIHAESPTITARHLFKLECNNCCDMIVTFFGIALAVEDLQWMELQQMQ